KADIECFFFSSRRRHTRSKRDWSSDVCSSDLGCPSSPVLLFVSIIGTSRVQAEPRPRMGRASRRPGKAQSWQSPSRPSTADTRRSEERRVGEEGGSGWSAYQSRRMKAKHREGR